MDIVLAKPKPALERSNSNGVHAEIESTDIVSLPWSCASELVADTVLSVMAVELKRGGLILRAVDQSEGHRAALENIREELAELSIEPNDFAIVGGGVIFIKQEFIGLKGFIGSEGLLPLDEQDWGRIAPALQDLVGASVKVALLDTSYFPGQKDAKVHQRAQFALERRTGTAA